MDDEIAHAMFRLLDALGEDVRRGYTPPLNEIYTILRARDTAHAKGQMGTPAYADTAHRMAEINDAIIVLIRAAYTIRHS